ncbi:Arc family DNA-binding protein [uncultured Intestinimonas sp.]|uniref:Arc family DNA-binding protein n=1 Tax=uncultured Intestinimonas sp. TaxID=1689265 RepID=UPI0025E4E8DA|nr:Arc family DNA-binding protein [uncultured Intestinimonas sp.]
MLIVLTSFYIGSKRLVALKSSLPALCDFYPVQLLRCRSYRFPKGKKDTIKAHAESHGQSVNSFINEAIDEKMERDGTPGGLEKSASPPTSPLRVVAKIPKRF